MPFPAASSRQATTRNTVLRWSLVLAVSILLHLALLAVLSHYATRAPVPPISSPLSTVLLTMQEAPPATPPIPKKPPQPPAASSPKESALPPESKEVPAKGPLDYDDTTLPVPDTGPIAPTEQQEILAQEIPATTETMQAETQEASTSETAEPPDYRFKPPASAILRYAIQKISREGESIHGSGTIEWQNNQTSYQLHGKFGILFITALQFGSRGTLGEIGLAPDWYTEQRLRRLENSTHFQRADQRIHFSISNERVALTGNAQDRASIIWQLASIGAGNSEHFFPGATIYFIVAGTRKAEPWPITVIGLEQMQFNGKQTDVWHLQRTALPDVHEQSLEVWLSPESGWYPLRLRYIEPDGSVLDMTLTDLNVSPNQQSHHQP